MFFYLRLHPGMLREKFDASASEKHQPKQYAEDLSIEWRQYCLDPICTNYNQIVRNVLKASALNNKTSPQSRPTSLKSSLNEQLIESHSPFPPQSPSHLFLSSNSKLSSWLLFFFIYLIQLYAFFIFSLEIK